MYTQQGCSHYPFPWLHVVLVKSPLAPINALSTVSAKPNKPNKLLSNPKEDNTVQVAPHEGCTPHPSIHQHYRKRERNFLRSVSTKGWKKGPPHGHGETGAPHNPRKKQVLSGHHAFLKEEGVCVWKTMAIISCSRTTLLQSPVQSIRGKNLDFSRSTIPTVGRYEKYSVFRKHRTSR